MVWFGLGSVLIKFPGNMCTHLQCSHRPIIYEKFMSACGRGGEHQLMSDSILSATAAAKEESNRNLGTASLIYVVQIYWIGERDCTVNLIVLWGCNCVFLISQFVQYRFVSVKRHRTRTEFSSVWLDLISRSKRKETGMAASPCNTH